MITLQFLTGALLVLFPYALTMDPNGSLRVAIARLAEKKGKDLRRVVQQLDNSETKLEPNEPYVVHKKSNLLANRDDTSTIIWKVNITEPGTYNLPSLALGKHKFPELRKYLTTTWTWSRQHNMDYILNVSQPVNIKVPDDSPFHVKSLGKDFWEFKEPMPWDEAEATCRAAGLKLAQPKSRKEVEELQKVLHKRIHNVESGCPDETWSKKNGYCFFLNNQFRTREQADRYCKSINSLLPYPALGDVTAWQEAIANSTNGQSSTLTHVGARKVLDGQWLWEDDSVVQDEAWTVGVDGTDECVTLTPKTGKILVKECSNLWPALCQGLSSNHWLGGLGSDDNKCVEWVDGDCIGKDNDHLTSNINDLWQTGLPGDQISSNYALLLQIEHEKPFTIMETTERKPFICESACPLGFINWGPQCLLVQKLWLPWHEAKAACVKSGLHLYETENESQLTEFLHSNGITGAYWIGGLKRSVAGKKLDMTNIKKLPFICELADGTRKMNVTNQLSYKDQEKAKLPKVITKSNNCTVTVKEKTITEKYPFSVQMDITGWIWVEYASPTDEHGSNLCDNNNDWVSGEWCWAHSKWGYSTSYLQDEDQIMAQGDNARMTLNGTVTYIYNEYEVSTCDSDRARRFKRATKRRRSKKSLASLKKSTKKYKDKATSQDNDDNNKPLMSYIGKRAGEWLRAQAQERNAHLVTYNIDQLSVTVTDMKLEQELSELMAPGAIFEEELENTGSEPVITSFSKSKRISNSFRWSVSKGLSVEDSHIASYSKANTQSESNTFSLSSNIAQTDGTSQSTSAGNTDSLTISQGTSDTTAIGASDTETSSASQSSSTGGSSSSGTSHTTSEGSSAGSSSSSSEGSTTGGSQSSSQSESTSSGSSATSSVSIGSSESESKGNTNTITDSKSESDTTGTSDTTSDSNTKSKSTTDTDSSSNSHSKGSSHEVGASGGGSFFGISLGASYGYSTNTNTESTRSSESSETSGSESTSTNEKSKNNEKTNTQEQSTSNEASQTSEQSSTSEHTDSKETHIGQEQTTGTDVSTSHETSKTDEKTTNQEITSNSEVGQTHEESQTFDNTFGQEKGSTAERNKNKEFSSNVETSQGKENSFNLDNSINQERSKSSESSRGGDVSKDSQSSQEAQKTHTHHINIDRNEDVETSEDETLDTTNEVKIPPNTKVKIEWRIEQRKIRLPWKANIHMTGWINVRYKNNDTVCDKHRGASGWSRDYTSACQKDNRLYGYPLSYLKDSNFIQQGEGLRFETSGGFEAVVVTSHYLRVTEIPLETEEDYPLDNANNVDDYYNPDDYYYDEPQPPQSRRRKKRTPRRLPSRVTDYPLEFDEHGNGRANIGKDNRYFRRFHAKKKYNGHRNRK